MGPMHSTSLMPNCHGPGPAPGGAAGAVAPVATSLFTPAIVALPGGRRQATSDTGASHGLAGAAGAATVTRRSARAWPVRIMATAATIMAAAPSVTGVTASPSTTAPSATATTGLTKAYVEADVAET